MWFKGKKRKAMVFVDYEHWYYGYRNQFHMKPNIDEWVEELKAEYDVVKLYVFGDFSEKGIDEDLACKLLNEQEYDPFESALRLAKKKKIGPYSKDKKLRKERRNKDMGILIRAGFDYDIVLNVLEWCED